MLAIERPTINADATAEAEPLDRPLVDVVAIHAQALQCPEFEFVGITMVWFDVIADCCWHDEPTCFTHGAQRMAPELVRSPTQPTRTAVPPIPSSSNARLHHHHFNFSLNNSLTRSFRRSIMTCLRMGRIERL
jgi:hypothetical protein